MVTIIVKLDSEESCTVVKMFIFVGLKINSISLFSNKLRGKPVTLCVKKQLINNKSGNELHENEQGRWMENV